MRKRASRGFTLIELLVALAMAAILVTVGIPSFRSWIRSSQITIQANSLVTALNLAKSEAIKRRGLNVLLCKQNSTGTACNNAGNWEDGWLLFVDANGDGAFADNGNTTLCETSGGLLSEDCLVRRFPPTPRITVRTGSNFACWIGFQMNATPKGSGSNCTGSGGGSDSFRLCPADSSDVANARFVAVGSSGRIKTERCASAAACAYTCP